MGAVFHIYGIDRMVYELQDFLRPHFVDSKHFDCSVRGRLSNALKGGTCQGEGPYLIVDREGDDVCAVGRHSPPPKK
jgi:hypothetical protein